MADRQAGDDDHYAEAAAAFVRAVDDGSLELPLPGGGATRRRWAMLSDLAERDLSVGRLGEGHADAVAILAEMGEPAAGRGERWGVWAAEPPSAGLSASSAPTGWRLTGRKRYCSGARVCTHALVTATADDGRRLFAVDLEQPGVRPLPGSWVAVGMAASDTLDVDFDAVAATAVGPPGAYLARPGFWHGGIGVAACWYGGACGLARTLLRAAADRDVGPYALAHLGEIDVVQTAAAEALDAAAVEIDAEPDGSETTVRRRALRVRAQIAAACDLTLDRVGRALGAGPLSHDAAHARRAADLSVYVRQHHAERALAELGSLAAREGVRW